MERLTPQEFIRKYKAAAAAKLTRDQFAKMLNILPDSVIRRRLAVKKEFSLDLPLLSLGSDKLTPELIEKYNHHLTIVQSKDKVKKDKNFSGYSKYVITSAQNATPVHAGFFSSLLNYCEINDAQLIVIKYRYKNPTSIFSNQQKDLDYWVTELDPYLCDDVIRLSDNLIIMGKIKIEPTATEPTSGFEGYTGNDSVIFVHPKIEFKTVATPSKSLPKILTTSGAITLPNYTDSKAGWKGQFHHSLAATIVELDKDDIFHIRHVHGDDISGAFYDIDSYYTTDGVTRGCRAAAIVTGDSHAEFIDPLVAKATDARDKKSIIDVTNPEIRCYHDVGDFYNRNHHSRNNGILRYGKHHYGRDNVEEGMQIVADFIDGNNRDHIRNKIVKANHDEAFDKWLEECEPDFDPENAAFYHYMRYHQLKSVRMTNNGFSSFDPFEFWCKNPESQSGLKSVRNTDFLKRGDSLVVNGIELALHGDVGPNGSRGNRKAFSKIGPKTIIGHSHSPGIYEGCYQVGTSSILDLEYTKGSPSSWLHTHCLVYPDGKRTLINIIKGRWRLEPGK
jgi:hypothetical protein